MAEFRAFRPARTVLSACDMTIRSTCLRRILTAAAVSAPLTAFAVDASAQTTGALTIGLQPQGLVTHTLPSGQDFTRDATLNPEGINFEDCERDVVLNFPLVASGSASAASGFALYAFAGTNCDQGSTYVSPGANTSTCWAVADGPIPYSLASGGFTVSLRARQILAQYATGVKQPFATVASSDDSACHVQPTSAALQVSVYFVFGTTLGLATIGGAGVVPLGVDLLAAAPPTTLSLDIFNGALKADWNVTADEDTVGYRVFHAPPASAQSAGDGGAASGASGSDCPSPFPPTLVAEGDGGAVSGSIADIGLQPREAQQAGYSSVTAAGNTTASAVLDGLTNGQEYAVGVAATDAYGNVGALSTFGDGDMICQAPLASAGSPPAAGDDSGGCSLGAGGGSGGAGAAALLAGAALVFALRRKKPAHGPAT